MIAFWLKRRKRSMTGLSHTKRNRKKRAVPVQYPGPSRQRARFGLRAWCCCSNRGSHPAEHRLERTRTVGLACLGSIDESAPLCLSRGYCNFAMSPFFVSRLVCMSVCMIVFVLSCFSMFKYVYILARILFQNTCTIPQHILGL